MNKNLKAVALKYEQSKDRAPKVIAKGEKNIAERILEIAKEHNIPIHQDSDLLELLYKLDIYQEIPEELYKAVAEILAYIYKANKKYY